MGGKNHQPCRGYLIESTRLSRALSLANANLEFANVELENLLLNELLVPNPSGTVSEITKHLEQSNAALQNAYEMIKAIRQKMDQNHFADLPALEEVDLDELGTTFTDRKMTQLRAWQTISTLMKNGGFSKVLTHFEYKISTLNTTTPHGNRVSTRTRQLWHS